MGSSKGTPWLDSEEKHSSDCLVDHHHHHEHDGDGAVDHGDGDYDDVVDHGDDDDVARVHDDDHVAGFGVARAAHLATDSDPLALLPVLLLLVLLLCYY